jgi:hypothetical protein
MLHASTQLHALHQVAGWLACWLAGWCVTLGLARVWLREGRDCIAGHHRLASSVSRSACLEIHY